MSLRLALVFALFMCVSAVSAANVQHIATYYDIDEAHTVFSYNITTDVDISYWMLGLDCGSVPPLANADINEFWRHFQQDPFSTDNYGYLWDMGQGAGTSKVYSIALNGMVQQGSVTYTLGGSGNNADVEIIGAGPACSGGDYPTEGCPADIIDPRLPCDEFVAEDGDVFHSDHCDDSFSVDRTHVIIDGDFESHCTQEIKVSDEKAPDFYPPADFEETIHIQCGDPIPPVPAMYANDTCDGTVADQELHLCDEIDEGDCPGHFFLTRTWTAVDRCGNSKCLTQTIVVEDNTPPVLEGVPDHQTIPCGETIPDPDSFPWPTVTATDSCNNCSAPAVQRKQEVISLCGDTYQLKRTFWAVDCCGNKAEESYYITIQDNGKPTIELLEPANNTVYCPDTPRPPKARAIDACGDVVLDDDLVPTVVDLSDGSLCEGQQLFKYVWTITDPCGNIDTHEEIIHVVDVNEPEFVHFPADAQYECGDEIPFEQATCYDECLGRQFDATYVDHLFDGECLDVIIREWTCTDACGNPFSRNQTISEFDNTPPEVDESTLPPNLTFSCKSEADEYFNSEEADLEIYLEPEITSVCQVKAAYKDNQDPRCTTNAADGHVVWLKGFPGGDRFIGAHEAGIYANTDPLLLEKDESTPGNFRVFMKGTVVQVGQLDRLWDVELEFTDHVPAGQKPCEGGLAIPDSGPAFCWGPKKELGNYNLPSNDVNSCYCPGCPADADAFEYYSHYRKLSLYGRGVLEGAHIEMRMRGPPSMWGFGGSNKNTHYGASFWLDWRVVSKSTGHSFMTNTNFPQDWSYGDFNFDIDGCEEDLVICPNDYTMFEHPHIIPGRCVNDYTIERTFQFIDCAGNDANATRWVNVNDTEAPTLHNVPADQRILCNETFTPNPAITATDNCDTQVGVSDEIIDTTTTGCDDVYTEHHKVTACDVCNNCAVDFYDVEYYDDVKPVFTFVPQDEEVECADYDDFTLDTPTAEDNCGQPSVTGPFIHHLGGECHHRRAEEWEYTATDDCGNVKKVNVTVTLIDNDKPLLTGLPDRELNVTCGNVPCPPKVTATDNCHGVDIDFVETSDVKDVCEDNIVEVITRTWTATDACDQETVFVQTIYVRDDTPPTVPDGYEYHVRCDNITEPTLPEITDDCDEDVTCELHKHIDQSYNPTCLQEYAHHFDWECVDNCGNVAWYNVTMFVDDDYQPTLSLPNGLENGTYNECDLKYLDPVAITSAIVCDDSCGECSAHLVDIETQNDEECPSEKYQILTFEGCDDCNNCDDLVFVQSSNDTKPPVLDQVDDTITYPCTAGTAPNVEAQDDCDDSVSVSYDGADESTCNVSYNRTWTAIDVCGNAAQRRQLVTVVDTEAPQFDFPEDWKETDTITTCHCLPSPPELTAYDACEGEIDVVRTRTPEQDPNNSCGWTVTWDFTATDSCGQVNSTLVVWTIVDNDAPLFTPPSHVDVTASCKLPNVDSPAAYDLCNSHTLVNESYREDGKGAHCFDYHVRWNATDDCGNSDVWGYTINVKDVTGPIVNFSFVPPHTDSQECTLPEAPTYTISDNCDPNPVINYTNPVNTECPYRQTETRTWSWSDDCGNGMSRTSVVSSTYEGPAEFQNLPSNSTLTCQKPPLPSLKAKDSCGGMYDAELISNIETPICPGSWHVERTWKVVDVCSEVNYYTQIRDSVDNTPPSHTSTLGDETRDFYHNGVCGIRAQPDISITDSCSNVNSSKTQTPAYPGCAYEPIVTEAWNAHDECGNDMDEFSREVTYTFEHDPIFHTSGDKRMEISCNDTLPVLIVTATDVCGNTVPVTGPVDTIKGQTCNNNYIVVRTWTATDDCGNTKDFVKEIRVKDDFDPVLIGVPADVNVECGCEPEPATVSAKDNCEGVNVTLREWRENEDPNNCCIFEIVREWTATDDCGRNVTGVQRITVRDKTPPRLTNVPADLCLNCTDDIPEPNVGAEEIEKALGFCVLSDNGASDCWPDYLTEPPVPHPSVIIGGVEYFPINDVHIIKYLKENRTLFYGQFGYNGGAAKIEINLENGVPKPVFDEDDNCFFGLKPECASLVNTDTWTVYPTITGTLTLDDGTEVSISGASNDVATLGAGVTGLNVHMGLRIPLADGVVNVALAQDQVGNCDLSHIDIPELSCDHEFEVDYNDTWSGDSCVNITDRLFWACDESNNCAYARQRITIKDQGNPWFINVPTGGDIDCNSAIPTAEEEYPDIADDCQEPTLDHEDDESGDICSGYTLTRTWYVSDGCGNTDSDETVYTQSDKEDPVLSVDEHETVGNCSYVPPYPTWSASDDCDEDLATEGWKQTRVDVIPGVVSCPNNYNLIRSLEVADDCGKTDDFEYTVVVRDTTAPTFNEEPGSLDENLSCEDELPTAAPTCSDECGESVTPTVLSEGWTHNGTCSATYVRTWECKDACSNSDTFSAIYIFTDGEDPVLVSGPSDFTKNCSDPTEPEAPVYRDTCSEVTVELIGTESLDPNPTECEPNTKVLDRVLYTWSVTDECNNHLTYTVTVTIVDEIAPSLENVPEDERFNCTEDVPCPDQVCASDNCNGIWLDFEETSSGVEGCGFEIVRTWTATDRCGNTAIDSQNIVVNDTVAPVFDGEDPTSNTVYCADWDGVEPEMATATDNCGTAHVTKHHSFAAGCGETGVWTWKFVAVDDCGNKAVRTWTTTITDAVGPDMVAPADEYYNCTHPGLTAGTYTDDCDTDVYVTTHEDPSYGKCDQEYNITVTYTGCDDCNNCNSTSYNIFVSDEFKPVWTSELPADVTVNCTDVPPSVNLTAHDDCDGDFEVVPVESIDARQCFTFITRTWTVSDECGNSIQHVQTITVTDEVKPYFTSVPDDQTVQCDNVVFVGEPTYDDNCDDDLSSHSYTNNNTDNECAVVVTRHWIIADDCGNEETASADVTVIDTTNPDLGLCDCSAEPDCVYCDQEFTCSDETNFILPANFPFPTSATDNCAVPDVTHGDEFEGHGCIERFSYHYWIKADDGCGNVDYRNFTYKVWDDEAPVFIRELDDVTVECDDLDTLGNLTLDDTEDNCGNAPAASIEGGELGNEPATCQNYTFTRTWIIKDDCGNTNTSDQVVTVYDGTAPTFDSDPVVPFNVSCEDVANYVQPDLDASDNCGEATVTKREYFDHDDGDECANSYTVFWEWTATDECGHTTVLTRSFPVYDDTNPGFVDFPADIHGDCSDELCPPKVTATDNCNGLDMSFVETSRQGDCDGSIILERTWTLLDDCNNDHSDTQIVNLTDSTGPTQVDADSYDGEIVYECTEEPLPDIPTFYDDCADNSSITVTNVSEIVASHPVCLANVTTRYTWTATDPCGNPTVVVQDVKEQDSQPPRITPPPFRCLGDLSPAVTLTMHNVSVNGKFFTAEDDCSAVRIEITGCYSNQDAYWNVDGQGAFNDHCSYDESMDKIHITPWNEPGNSEGRRWIITAVAIDACGHRTPADMKLWLPNGSSDQVCNLPPGDPFFPDTFDFDACIEECTVPVNCEDECPCEYNAGQECDESADGNLLEALVGSPVVADGTTTYTYKLLNEASRVTIGLNLCGAVLVGYTPDAVGIEVQFGKQKDSFLDGISWISDSPIPAGTEFSFTLQGVYGAHTAQIPVQFNGGNINLFNRDTENDCSEITTIDGPVAGSVSHSGITVSGVVSIGGALTGENRAANIPLAGVVVQLVQTGDLSKTVIARAFTDENGAYSFHVDDVDSHEVVIGAEGFLRRPHNKEFATGCPGQMIHDGVFQVGDYNLFPFGRPRAITAGSGNDFTLVIDDMIDPPYYVQYAASAEVSKFQGNSYPVSWWKYQVAGNGVRALPDAVLASYIAGADASLGACGSVASFFASGEAWKQQLATAYLNAAANRGIFEPFDVLQPIWTEYARYVFCDLAATPTSKDGKAALALLDDVNDAQRSFEFSASP